MGYQSLIDMCSMNAWSMALVTGSQANAQNKPTNSIKEAWLVISKTSYPYYYYYY